MALDILSIPAMSAEPERLFSGAKISITDRRNRLGISVGSSTHCDPSSLFILRVYTVRISNIELHTRSISSTICQYIFIHGVQLDTLPRRPNQKIRIQPPKLY